MAAAASGAPPLMFQKHPSVPTSNTPPTFEWATHGWYNLRLDALQASVTLDDAQAELLVKAFESRSVTLPCPDCRAHFIQEWAEAPFTLAHARSAPAAIAWVETFKAKVDAHVAKKIAATATQRGTGKHASATVQTVAPVAAPAPPARPSLLHSRPLRGAQSAARTAPIPTAAPAPTAVVSAKHVQPPAARRLTPAAVSAHRTPTILSVRAAAARMPVRAATTAGGDAMQRNVAIASALQQTRANASGHRGCNCGRR